MRGLSADLRAHVAQQVLRPHLQQLRPFPRPRRPCSKWTHTPLLPRPPGPRRPVAVLLCCGCVGPCRGGGRWEEVRGAEEVARAGAADLAPVEVEDPNLARNDPVELCRWCEGGAQKQGVTEGRRTNEREGGIFEGDPPDPSWPSGAACGVQRLRAPARTRDFAITDHQIRQMLCISHGGIKASDRPPLPPPTPPTHPPHLRRPPLHPYRARKNPHPHSHPD
jgi:hypothetical protein